MTEATPAPPPPPPYGLRWAIKASFLGYVSRMPDGRAYLGEGASVNDRNELLFPLDEEIRTEPDTFAFGGDVRFSGHFGMLYVQIARPRIEVREGKGEMTVINPESKDGERLRLVTFTLSGPAEEGDLDRWEAIDVALAAEGVEVFGEVYQEGEPFEPLTITRPRQG